MSTQEFLTVTGALTISINGKVVRNINNLIVTAGKTFILSRMKENTAGVMTHMAFGSGTTAAAITQTTLVTEGDRNALNVSGGVVAGSTITYECTWAADDPDITAPAVTTITEAGIFNASSGGTMLCRTVFGAISKGEADSMTISWVVTLT